ncbi:type VI secretion system baseplate subunit TssK [Candidatus Hepatobacter penaei]|uniref:type VI secretion system baseplate subunit TssK n=1 Tax=Candidatus Hepatobacter penaei TaxID=1274402 RepID=UPI0010936F36|nr:type VI secretion system baseplate subunit TssK [Candidatus Hepatobacter penaei]TGW14786.1 type VI secretion system baseplate subunit TssK [bacterium NHP-B]
MSFNAHPIQWYEGMFMMPHHFQENDTLHQNLWQHHLQYLAPYHWGITHMSFDESALAQGVFKILKLQAVMPDGTVIFFPDAHDESLELSLHDHLEDDRKPHTLFLSLFKKSVHEGKKDTFSSRHKPVESASHDINAPDSHINITRLKPILTLGFDKKNQAQRVFLPLAILTRDGLKITPTPYMPPCIHLDKSTPFFTRCRTLSKSLRDKVMYLQKKVRQRARATTSLFDAQSIWQFDTMRRHLIVALINFEALLQEAQLSPYVLYRELLHVASRCAAIKWGGAAPSLPPYQHENLHVCFDDIITFIEQSLAEIEEAYRVYAFQKTDRLFTLTVDQAWLDQPLIIGLKAPPNQTEERMVSWIKNAVIVSQSRIKTVQENRILGATRNYIQTAEKIRLIPDRGTVLCEIIPDNDFIKPDEPLHIFNMSDDPAKRPEQIIFYAPQNEDA